MIILHSSTQYTLRFITIVQSLTFKSSHPKSQVQQVKITRGFRSCQKEGVKGLSKENKRTWNISILKGSRGNLKDMSKACR